MAIGPIGAVAYANQATPAQTKLQSNFQNRLDMQNGVAAAIQDADKQEIEDVRPAEETYKIDPEHEHEKEKKEQEQKGQEEKPEEKVIFKKDDDEDIATSHHLDIKV
jgi:hypothetical protein